MAARNDLDRRLRRLESLFERGITVSPSLPTARPEVYVMGAGGVPVAETAQILAAPGLTVWLPAGCGVVVARIKHGQDPVILGGTGTPAAVQAARALALTYGAIAGGLVLAEPVAGAHAIVLGPNGGALVGDWELNGLEIQTIPVPG
jgi:hypothetical protein